VVLPAAILAAATTGTKTGLGLGHQSVEPPVLCSRRALGGAGASCEFELRAQLRQRPRSPASPPILRAIGKAVDRRLELYFHPLENEFAAGGFGSQTRLDNPASLLDTDAIEAAAGAKTTMLRKPSG
jgi:hypothetical protein